MRRWGLAIFAMFVSLSAAAADLNQQGFELLKKGKFSAAQGFVQKALEKDPSNPYAHLNMARILFQMAADKDVEALFNFEAELSEEPPSVGYTVLWHLSRAAESKKPDIYQKLKDEDRWLKQLRSTGLYQRWIRSIQKIPTGSELKSVLTKSEWWAYSNSGETWNVVFKLDSSGRIFKSGPDGKRSEFGSWELVKGNEIVLKPAKGNKTSLRLSQIRTAFGQNSRYFFNLGLVVAGASDPVYILGPRVGDCGEFNY